MLTSASFMHLSPHKAEIFLFWRNTPSSPRRGGIIHSPPRADRATNPRRRRRRHIISATSKGCCRRRRRRGRSSSAPSPRNDDDEKGNRERGKTPSSSKGGWRKEEPLDAARRSCDEPTPTLTSPHHLGDVERIVSTASSSMATIVAP